MDDLPSVDLCTLATTLRITDIRVLARGHGGLSADMQTLHRLRGAFGQVLHDSAPDTARAQRRSGYDVFHTAEPGLRRGQAMPKPFVFQADDLAGDLRITLRLFGDGDVWAAEFQAALVAAFRRGIDGTGPLAVQGSDRHVMALPLLPLDSAAISLTAITPIVQRREKDGSGREPAPDRPQAAHLLERMAERAAGLAQWQGLRPDYDGQALRRDARAVAALADWDDLTATGFHRGGRRLAKRDRTGFLGTLTLPAPGPDLVALACLAGVAHIGADTAMGAGRVLVTAYPQGKAWVSPTLRTHS